MARATGPCVCLALLVACLVTAPAAAGSGQIAWQPTKPGETCDKVCAEVGIVTLEVFNFKLTSSLCGRVSPKPGGGQRLAVGTANGGTCTVSTSAGSKPQTYSSGDFLCGCDLTRVASMVEWRRLPGCPADKRTKYSVVCAGLRSGTMNDYSFGFVDNVSGTSKCISPLGVSEEFYVLCDYP